MDNRPVTRMPKAPRTPIVTQEDIAAEPPASEEEYLDYAPGGGGSSIRLTGEFGLAIRGLDGSLFVTPVHQVMAYRVSGPWVATDEEAQDLCLVCTLALYMVESSIELEFDLSLAEEVIHNALYPTLTGAPHDGGRP